MADLLLALDQGTSSSRALLFDREARLVSAHQVALPIQFPQPGWVEQDANAIWTTQRDAARVAIDAGCGAGDRILAIGITNQRETAIVWERETLEPIGPAIVWQCRRTAAASSDLAASLDTQIRQRTGLIADAYFSGLKIAWLLDHAPGARARADAGDLVAGTVDSWLLAKLTDGAVHATDRTNASRTLLYDIHADAWDAELAAGQRVPIDLLGSVKPSLGEFGVARERHLGSEAPILAMAGDQQAALFGQACHGPGAVKATYGTGAFLLTHTGREAVGPHPGLLTTTAAATTGAPDQAAFALEGSVFTAGSLVQWLRDGLGLIETSDEIEELARATADSGGVSLVPAFTGLGAPHWESETRTMIAGISRGTAAPHLARAALEGVAFRVREVVEAMEGVIGPPIEELRVDGGAARNDLLLQIQANALQRAVVRPKQTETTALGVALMAGVVAGVWPDVESTAAAWRPDVRFEPAGDLEAAYTRWEATRDAALHLGRIAE